MKTNLRNKTGCIFLSASLLQILPPGLAAAGNDIASGIHAESEEDFTREIDTVISATRIRQPLTESPSSITIIDRDAIVASGAVEIADVLRLVPGIQVAYPQGNQLAVTYHGYGDAFPRDMQVQIDGRSVYQPSFGDVDWLFLGITLEDIERIEVIRGPNTPFYGSNAVAGVINIITRLPLQDRGTLARLTAGDLKTRNAVLRHGDRLGDLDYRMTLNYQSGEGFDTNINSTNDNREIAGISLRGTWNPQPHDEVDIQLGFSDGNTGGGAEPTNDPPPHDKQVTSDYQFIKWRRALRDESDIQVQFYRNHYDSDDHFRDTLSHAFEATPAEIIGLLSFGLGIAPADVIALYGPDPEASFGLFDYEGERYDLELQYTSPASGRLRAVIGAGLRLNRLRSPALTDRRDWIDELSERAYANITYNATDRIILNLGLFAENSDEFGAHLSPRLNATYLFSPQQSIRLSYARAKRNPSLVEGHANTVYKLDDGTPYLFDIVTGNPDPETLTSLELGYIGYWLDRKLLVDVKLFHEKTDDFMHPVRDCALPQAFGPACTPPLDLPALSVFGNDGHRTVQGGEFQIKYQTAPRDFISLQASILETDNVGNRQINSPTEPDRPFFPNELVAPKYTVSLLLSKALGAGLEASAAAYRVDNMVWLGDGDRIKGYGRVDLRLAKRWQTGNSNMMLEGIVQNAGDSYITFRNDNFFDTRAYLRFTMEFL